MVMVMVMIVMMYYLSSIPAGGIFDDVDGDGDDVICPSGGITAFPRLGVAAKPELGAAIFWHNIKVTSNIRKNK